MVFHVLVCCSSSLRADSANLERCFKNHVELQVHMSNHTGSFRNASSTHSKLEQILHFMASSVDPIHKLVGSFTFLFGLNHFQPLQLKLSAAVLHGT